jgi:hypothetical protein
MSVKTPLDDFLDDSHTSSCRQQEKSSPTEWQHAVDMVLQKHLAAGHSKASVEEDATTLFKTFLTPEMATAMQLLPPKVTKAFRSFLKRSRTCCTRNHPHDDFQNPPDFAQFLKAARGDPWAASKRLASYWTEREMMFGSQQEHTYGPSSGWLSKREKDALKSNFLVILPMSEARSLPVLFWDPWCSPFEGREDALSQRRVLFYMLAILSEQGNESIRILIREDIAACSSFQEVDQALYHTLTSWIGSILPLIVQDIHVCSFHEGKKSWLWKSSGLSSVWGSQAHIHDYDSAVQLCKILEQNSFRRACLPTSLGGGWRSTHNKANSLPESALSRHRRSFDRTLMLIPQKEKLGYLQAIRRAPLLVEEESPPELFIRHERNHSMKAVRRFLTYWEERVKIYENRAFLPIVQTGEGALGPAELEAWKTRYLVNLPQDECGRGTLCYSPGRITIEGPERLRCAFYAFSLLMQNERSLDEGFLVVAMFDNPGFYRATGRTKPADLLRRAFPCRLRELHLVQCLHSGEKFSFFKRLVPTIIGLYAFDHFKIHSGYSRWEIREILEANNLRAHRFPEWLGGELTIQKLDEIECVRAVEEKERCSKQNWPVRRSTGRRGAKLKVVPETELDHLTHDERKRKMDAIYSKRKRARRKAKYGALQEEFSTELIMNMSLRSEEKRLEDLLKQANQIVAVDHQLSVANERAIWPDTCLRVPLKTVATLGSRHLSAPESVAEDPSERSRAFFQTMHRSAPIGNNS